jgi:hypothetical protein
VIGLRTALILYGLLGIAALATLKGTALAVALFVVVALAAKSYLHQLRSRVE